MTLFTPLQDQLGKDVFQIPGEFDPARHIHDFLVGAPAEANILGVAYPRSTAEVSEILTFCNTHNIAVTPQGGMTGLAGGGVPIGTCVILSMERMRAIEEIDVAAGTMTVQAGIPLEGVQGRRRGRPVLPAGPRRARHRSGRRQRLHQRRRQPRGPLWHDAVVGAGHGVGDGRRHGRHLAQQDDQEQRRL